MADGDHYRNLRQRRLFHGDVPAWGLGANGRGEEQVEIEGSDDACYRPYDAVPHFVAPLTCDMDSRVI
jgi:hypothetical protein